MNVKLSGIVEQLFCITRESFNLHAILVVVMDLQISKIGCVNYVHFPKSGHICMSTHIKY